MAADDRYTIPGSGGVLKNKLNLTTQDRLDRAMNEAATVEWAIMCQEPIPGKLDLNYLTSIHRRLLSPVLPWAGEMRRFGDEVVAGGTSITYARSDYFRSGLDEVFGQLAREDYLSDLEPREFADRLAERWGYLTTIHPFRDGNTRTQSAYVDRLAVRAGHPIDWINVDVPTLRALRLAAVTGPEKPLADYLYERLIPQQSLENAAKHTVAGSSQLFATRDATPTAPEPRSSDHRATRETLAERHRRFPELADNANQDPEADLPAHLEL